MSISNWTPPETSGGWAASVIHCLRGVERIMAKQAGFWSVEDRLAEISAGGDPLETLNATVDFERFRPILERAAGRARSPKGGRPSLDVVLKFRMLVLQSLHGLSLEATERMVRDRLSWMRFCGLGVISPFLTGCIRRTYAAIFSFMAGVMPPMPMLGRSLL
jgi:hypothetical protein